MASPERVRFFGGPSSDDASCQSPPNRGDVCRTSGTAPFRQRVSQSWWILWLVVVPIIVFARLLQINAAVSIPGNDSHAYAGAGAPAPPEEWENALNALPSLLPYEALDRGLAYTGSGDRMRGFVSKLLRGQRVKVVAMGGSTTAGRGAYRGRPYPARVGEWLDRTFPGANHTVVNIGMGATSSTLFSVCNEALIPRDADLYVLEFAVNDRWWDDMESAARKEFELLLRWLLRLPATPAAASPPAKSPFSPYSPGRNATLAAMAAAPARPALPAVALLMQFSLFVSRERFYNSAERDLGTIAQYYDVPVLSLRNAVWPLVQARVPGYWVNATVQRVLKNATDENRPGSEGVDSSYLYYDDIHPADCTGHRMLADLIAGLVRRTAEDWVRKLRREALSEAGLAPAGLEPAAREAARLRRQAKPPVWGGPSMLPNNRDRKATACFTQDGMRDVATQAQNWTWEAAVPEADTPGAQKWGWTGRGAGAALQVELDSRVPGEPGDGAVLSVGFVRSATRHGDALVTCANCACEPTTLPGKWADASAQADLKNVAVTQHKHCRVTVSVKAAAESATPTELVVVRAMIVASAKARLPVLSDHQGEKLTG